MRGIEAMANIVRWVGYAAACILIPAQLAISVFYVIGRQFLLLPATRLQELEWHVFMTLVFLTLGLAYLDDRHVRIDVIRHRFSDRTRATIELAGFVIALIPFCLVVMYVGTLAAWQSFATGEASRSPTGLPHRWIIRSVVPLGALFLLMAGSVVGARNIAILRR